MKTVSKATVRHVRARSVGLPRWKGPQASLVEMIGYKIHCPFVTLTVYFDRLRNLKLTVTLVIEYTAD